MKRFLLFSMIAGALILCIGSFRDSRLSASPDPLQLKVKILAVHPHDPQAFTQGLILYKGQLYESTGIYGRSTLRQLDRSTGKILRSIELPGKLFGEGLERVNEQLIQLTWKENVAHVYDLKTFTKLKEFQYKGEGWGLCFDGKKLIRSDGTDRLSFHDPLTFEKIDDVRVKFKDQSPLRINELEWAKGAVYANNWPLDEILRIDIHTGNVTAIINASGLLSSQESKNTDVLNGIAFDPQNETFLLSGKYWPKMFEVVFVPNI